MTFCNSFLFGYFENIRYWKYLKQSRMNIRMYSWQLQVTEWISEYIRCHIRVRIFSNMNIFDKNVFEYSLRSGLSCPTSNVCPSRVHRNVRNLIQHSPNLYSANLLLPMLFLLLKGLVCLLNFWSGDLVSPPFLYILLLFWRKATRLANSKLHGSKISTMLLQALSHHCGLLNVAAVPPPTSRL